MRDGTGQVESVRDIFLLCDAEHRWHLVGEGPELNLHSRIGLSCYHADRLISKVKWTGDANKPVEIACTLIITWFCPAEAKFEYENPSLDIRRDLTVTGTDSKDLHWQETEYVVAEEAESLDRFAFRVARWRVPSFETPEYRDKHPGILGSVRQCLLKANPLLSDPLAAGQRVVIPRTIEELDCLATTRPAKNVAGEK